MLTVKLLLVATLMLQAASTSAASLHHSPVSLKAENENLLVVADPAMQSNGASEERSTRQKRKVKVGPDMSWEDMNELAEEKFRNQGKNVDEWKQREFAVGAEVSRRICEKYGPHADTSGGDLQVTRDIFIWLGEVRRMSPEELQRLTEKQDSKCGSKRGQGPHAGKGTETGKSESSDSKSGTNWLVIGGAIAAVVLLVLVVVVIACVCRR